MHFTAHDELQLFLLLAALGVMLVAAASQRLPPSILLVGGGLVLGFVPGLPHLTLPPDLVLVAILPPLLYSVGVLHRPARAALEPPADLAARDRARRRHHRRRGVGRARGDRRPLLGRRVHARRDRLADRRARVDRGGPARRRTAARDRDHRRREPRQRRDRARALQDGRRGGGHRRLLVLERIRAPLPQRDRRTRRRARGGLGGAPGAPPRRRHPDRGGARAPLRLPRLPARSGARRLRRARRGHDRRLHGLVHAAAHDRRDPALGQRVLGDPRLPRQCSAVRARRAAAARHPRPAQRDRFADRRRGVRDGAR